MYFVSYNQLIQKIPMKKLIFSNPCKNHKELSDKFLKDPKSDFLLILNQKIYPLHRQVMRQSLYLQPFIEQNAKIHVLDTDYDMNVFEQILGYLYGMNLNLDRNGTMKFFLQVIMFLGITSLENAILEDMKQNYQEYGIFTILEYSCTFRLKQLYNLCIQELVSLQFQQVMINKYDLLYCSKNIFEHVIQEHANMKKEGLIKGLKEQDLKLVIRDYYQTKGFNLNGQYFGNQNEAQFLITNSKNQDKKKSKSLKDIENGENVLQVAINLFKNKSCNQVREVQKKQQSQDKQAKLLCKLNSKMIQKNKQIENELLELKSQMSDKSQSQTKDEIEDLEQRCEELTKIGKCQKIKLETLKNSILSLSMQSSSSFDLHEVSYRGQFKKPRSKTDCHPKPQRAIKF